MSIDQITEFFNSHLTQIVNILPWIPTIIFGIIILWQFFAGFRRGRVKSIKLFITFILSIVVATIFFIVVRKNFDSLFVSVCNKANINIGERFNTSENHDTLTGYLEEYLSNNESVLTAIEQYGFSVTEAAKFIYSLSLLIVNLALYLVSIVVFFIAKFIFYIFYLIFAKEGRRKKKINKRAQTYPSERPYKKHKFTGGLVGVVRGFIVSIFVLAPFGIISLLITNGESYDLNNEELPNEDTKTVAEIVRVVTKYDNVGIGKVLSSVKNKDGLPIYLIVADKLTTTSYTYTDEEGEHTIELSLSKDISSLTRPVCKTAYLFLKYGYDYTKSGDADYLSNFLASDKQIDGKTLEEAVSETLKDLTVDEQSMLGYTCNMLAIGLAQNAVGEGVNDENINSQELGNKLLYHAFLGKNAIKTTDIVSGNAAAVFKVYVDIMKYQNEINALNNLSQNNDTTLVYGIARSVSSEETTRGADFTELLYNDLCGLSFFNTDRFNKLITDCVTDVLSTYIPEFDFTLTTNQKLYDIKWKESIKTIFTSFGALIDNVVNNNIQTQDELMHFYISALSNKETALYERIDSIIDTSAISIILNTNGFNKLIEDTLNNSLSSITNESITLPKTYWGSYTDGDENVQSGEIKKIIDSVLPTFANIFDVTYGTTELSNEQIVEVVQAITNPDSKFYDVIDTEKENHSVLIHSLLSSIMSNLSITYNEEQIKIYYEDSVKQTITSNGEEISVFTTASLKDLLGFLYTNAESIPQIQDGSVDFVSLVKDNISAIKNSTILLDLSSQLLYSFTSDYLEIPERLSLDESSVEKNLVLWTDQSDVEAENGEFIKLLNIIEEQFDIIKEATNSDSDADKLITKVAKASEESILNLVSSTIINATFTKNVVSATEGSDFVIEIPDYAYNDSYKDTLKASEYLSLIKFFKYSYNISDTTETVDFTSLKYKRVLEDETISLIKNSSIALTSSAYWFNDILSNNESVNEYLEIPQTYRNDIDNDTIKSNYEESPWKEELPHLLGNIKLLGVDIKEDNSINMNLKQVFYLGDKVDGSDQTKTDKLFESTILKASLTKSINTIDAIYLPNDVYDNDNYITSVACSATFSSFKELIGEETLARDDFSVENIKSAINLEKYTGENIETLVDIVKPHIVNATISKMIVDQESESFVLPKGYSFNESDETNLVNKWYYISSEKEGELVKVLRSVNTLGALSAVSSDSGFNGIKTNAILKSADNMDTLLDSQIVWYTMSNKMFDIDSLIFTNNSEETVIDDNEQLYITKNEFKALVSALDVVAKEDENGEKDFNDIDLSVKTANEYKDQILASSIIRTKVTVEIENGGNEIVMSRSLKTSTESSEKEVYANTFNKYVDKKDSEESVVQLVQSEIALFLEAAAKFTDDDYSIEYNNTEKVQINKENLTYFKSTIILSGLQERLAALHLEEQDYDYVLHNAENPNFVSYETLEEYINTITV